MKKKILSLLLSVVMVFTMVTVMPFSFVGVSAATVPDAKEPAIGEGTENFPYGIANAAELLWFLQKTHASPWICGQLLEDIDASSICGSGTNSLAYYNGNTTYIGTLNGDGYTISNTYNGLFHSIGTGQDNNGVVKCGTVKNLTVQGTYAANGGKYIGGICNWLLDGGKISNCIINISMIGNSESYDIGGVCGYIDARNSPAYITNCQNLGNVTGGVDVGGICGYGYGEAVISGCINKGIITNIGTHDQQNVLGGGDLVGGICGGMDPYRDGDDAEHSGSITRCLNTGSVSGKRLVGGICGRLDWFKLTECTNTGTVTGDSYTGGICGIVNFATGTGTASVTNCLNNGVVSVSGEHGGNILGTIGMGETSTTISNCYYQSGINDSIGGWDGANDAGKDEPRSKQQFLSGELCYAMNNGLTDSRTVWFQTLGKDTAPLPAGCGTTSKVYRVKQYSDCMNKKGTIIYRNTNADIPGTNHEYFDKDGICACGNGYQPATLVNGNYRISNRGQMIWFAALVNGDTGITCGVAQNASAKALLTADISLDNTFPRLGTSASPYSGTFDGGGHTLTVNYTVTADFVGGLCDYVNGATIKNINITGSITTSNRYAGGLISFEPNNVSTVTLENILSSVNITSKYTGDSYNGGIISITNSDITMTNCGYTGTITAQGTACSGLDAITNAKATFNNCYMAGTISQNGTNKLATFCRVNGNGNTVFNNCYYLNSYGTVQGTQKSAAQFKSGEVTYLLNNGKTDGTQSWYQTCGTGLPGLSGKTVYGGYVNCGSKEKTYSNSSLNKTLPSHTFGNYIDNSDGTHTHICSVCSTVETKNHNNVCIDNGNGTHTCTCSDCGRVEIVEHTLGAWSDNGDGMHIRTCSACGKTEKEEHTFTNGVCTVCGSYETPVYNNNGTTDILTDDYYEIGNAGNLLWFAKFVNSGNTTANAVLTGNINMTGITWTTIASYKGTLDGNGFTISNTNNLFIASLLSGGTIKNLTIKGENFFPGANDCGGIVGTNAGIIEKCIVKDQYIQYSGNASFGGIAGNNTATGIIKNSAIIGGTLMLRYSSVGSNSIGGITAQNSGTVENCYLYKTAVRNGVTQSAIVFNVADGHEPINCYFVASSYPVENSKGGTAMTIEQFASGEVAAMLQEGCTEITWGQGNNDSVPVLTTDKALAKKRATFNYNGLTTTQIFNYNDKLTLPKPVTNDGSTVLYWAKADGTAYRVSEGFVSGLELTAVMSYTKLVTVDNSVLSVDRTNNVISSGAVLTGRTVKDYKDNFKNDNSLIVIETADGIALSDTEIAGTGCVIKSISELDGETVIDSLTIIISGDVNGDGLLNDSDYDVLLSNAFNCALNGVYFTAADINKDGVIDFFDASLLDLMKSSLNGTLTYKVSSEQTLTSLKEHYGDNITVYNANGDVVPDTAELLGTGAKITYTSNGISLTQNLVVEAV